ncbi:MAG TPA: LLM class flavin-dependent oxidoreductase [Streptosporangiaceae bacterium]|nr:LLM class flavin-dependent oxidoreductase [Streptosporangiaceae bacterium]
MSSLPRVGIVFRPQLPPERLAGFVAAAEAAGLDDLWLWEDCFLEGGLTSAAAALAWSGSLRVGLGLMPAPLRNPALAAMEIATLARLFPGRFVPALGHGVQDWMGQVGARAASPMGLLREWATAVRSLLSGDKVTVAGTYVNLDGVALDWPPAAAVPVLIGARGPKTLALAGELADGLVLDAGTSPDTVRRAMAQAAAVRPHDIVVYLPCGAGPGSAERIQAELPPSAPSAPPGADLAAVGSPAEVAATIRAFARAGATTIVLQPAGDDPDVAATIELAGAARSVLHSGDAP